MGLLDDEVVNPPKVNKNKLQSAANNLLKSKKLRRSKKTKNKLKIPKMNYCTYIKSKYWKRRKNNYFGKYGKKCAVCGNKNGVSLHHKQYNYKLNGKEPDHFFVALCRRHYYEFHTNHKLQKNMTEDTDMYVATMKQVENSNINDLNWIQ